MDGLGMMATASAASQMISNLTGGAIDMGRNKALMGLQQDYQKNLNAQAFEYGKKMFDYTSYPHQVEMLKKAGLNPSLIYSKGGNAGTTSMPSGGGAPGGHYTPRHMDISAIINARLMESQVKVNEAQAAKLAADAAKTSGVDTQKTTAETHLLSVNNKIATIQEKLASGTLHESIEQVKHTNNKLMAEATSLITQNEIATATKATQIQKTAQELVNLEIQAESMKAGQKLTEAQTTQISASIAQKWQELKLQGKSIEINEFDAMTKKIQQEYNITHPNILQIVGQAFKRFDDLVQNAKEGEPQSAEEFWRKKFESGESIPSEWYKKIKK